MRNLYLPLALLLLAVLAACSNNDGPKSSTSRVYADYKIWGEEGKETVTCLLQFHEENKDGATLLLDGVMLDGEALTADSTRLTGAYYEVQKPLSSFTGTHTITFTDADGVVHKETFSFEPLVLVNDLGGTISRRLGELQVQGAAPDEPIRVLLTDTSFTTEDINSVQNAIDGRLLLPQKGLEKIVSGPVTLRLYKEIERPLQNGTPAGGRLAITYSLLRELELTD